ncbi:hypothetical protein [Pedobacter sp.]|uniref:hypothetical protein n=1 Tax=Pedobacter sp. TaxID=1411316 RepID=UPI003BAD98D5
MKKIRVSIILLTFWLALASFYSNAQSAMINGDKLIEQLIETRYHFNKQLIKGKPVALPQSVSIVEGAQCSILFNGAEYLISHNQIVGIKGLSLAVNTLQAINERILFLDRIQRTCSEKANLTYGAASRDLQYVKTLDRRYFAALNNLRSFTSNIAINAKKPKPSVWIEMFIAKTDIPKELLAQNQITSGN